MSRLKVLMGRLGSVVKSSVREEHVDHRNERERLQ